MALLMVGGMTLAAGPRGIRKQAEMSMGLSGWITIAPDGHVIAVTLDQEKTIGEPFVNFVRSAVMGWVFEPVIIGGQAVTARATMRLNILGKHRDDGGLDVSINSAYFGGNNPDASKVKSKTLTPPDYPRDMLAMGAQGIANLVLKVGRDGRVADLYVEQVNLNVVAPNEATMRRIRQSLGNAAMTVARTWEFQVPTQSPEMDKPYWIVRVPVQYCMNDDCDHNRGQDGEWHAYIPGPRQRAPWISDTAWVNGANSDALAPGGIYMADNTDGPKLLTPLGD